MDNSFEKLASDSGVPFDALTPLPDWSAEALAGMTEDELLVILTTHEDRVPRTVVDECASRGEGMVPLLRAHFNAESSWQENVTDGDWWGLLHAVFILGLIPGEISAEALLQCFRRITFDSNGSLADWFSGEWVAMFSNKTEFAAEAFREIAEDQDLGWYPRSHAAECYVAASVKQGNVQTEAALDWLAGLCSNEAEDREFRVLAAQTLLDLPRERHRPLMDALVQLQDTDSWLGSHFRRDDIDYAFGHGDQPSWQRFDDPWQFYEPKMIMQRQIRWYREGRARDEHVEPLVSAPLAPTLVRDQPKIGRNSPCPCGSGKKFKKCCLPNLH